MEIHVTQQALVFLCTVLCGNISGLLYDIFRISRRLFKPKDGIVFLSDLFFWMCTSVLLFGIILRVNSGEIRWFEFAGAIIGAGVYFLLFSRIFTGIIMAVLRVIVKVGIFIWKIIMVPIGWLKKPARAIGKKTGAVTSKLKRSTRVFKRKFNQNVKLLKKVRKST